MISAQAYDEIIASLRQEFIESAVDQLADIEHLLDQLEVGKTLSEDELFSIPRNIHNIKGQGATFGFPLVGQIAHLLEDYLENASGVRRELLPDLRQYLDSMAKFLDVGKEPIDNEAEALLASLPYFNKADGYLSQKTNDVQILLAMPPGLQRKVVSRELLSCGFQVNRAYDALETLSLALSFKPDIVMVNGEFDPFDGVELAKVFSSIECLCDIHFVIFSAFEESSAHFAETPDNVSIVVKRGDFRETLRELFISWGVFGELGGATDLSPEQSIGVGTVPGASKNKMPQRPN